MPFTFSHPAAVLPLIRDDARGRGRLVGSALVAGSLAPDLPFFLDSVVPGSYGLGHTAHRPWATATLDVALATVAVALWRMALREPAFAALPEPWADRLRQQPQQPGPERPRPGGTAADAGWFAASATLGALTHIGWDAFTHHGRFGTRLLPALERPLIGRMPGYQALQWTTSAVGLAALARAAARRPPADAAPHGTAATRRPVNTRARARSRALIAAGTLLGAAHRLHRDLAPARSPRGSRHLPPPGELVAYATFGGGAGAVAGALVSAAVDALAPRPAKGLPSEAH